MFQSIPQQPVKDDTMEMDKQEATEAGWKDDKHEEVHSTVDVKVWLKFKTTLDKYMKWTVMFQSKTEQSVKGASIETVTETTQVQEGTDDIQSILDIQVHE